MLTRFDITFGRELTEEEQDKIICYLDENITDDWIAHICPEKEPSERENRKNIKWVRRQLKRIEKKEKFFNEIKIRFKKIKELQVQLDEEKSINNKLNAKVQKLERKLNTNDNTWEIMCIISHFNDAIKNVDRFSDDYEKLEEKYVQAIRLQCRNYGYIMVREDFIACVKDGSFIDYDGCGVFLDFDGNEHESTRCDVEYLKKFEYPFVAWFNK